MWFKNKQRAWGSVMDRENKLSWGYIHALCARSFSSFFLFSFITCGFSQCQTNTIAMKGFSLVVLTETKTLKFQNMSILQGKKNVPIILNCCEQFLLLPLRRFFLCPFAGWFVSSRITQKPQNGFSWDLGGGWVSGQNKPHDVWVQMWIKRIFFSLSITSQARTCLLTSQG